MNTIKNLLWKLKEFLKKIFLYPRTTIDVTKNHDYDYYWDNRENNNESNRLNSWQMLRTQMTIEILHKSTIHSIADIASGSGNILLYLKEKLKIEKAIAYDVSRKSVDKASSAGLEAEILNVQNYEELSRIKTCEYFLLFEILEHLPNAEEVLSVVFQKAEKGVFISVPNTGYLSHRLRLLFGKFPLQWRVFPNEHVRFWTLADMRWWLNAQGFRNYKIRTYMGVPFLNKVWPSLFAGGVYVYLPKKG